MNTIIASQVSGKKIYTYTFDISAFTKRQKHQISYAIHFNGGMRFSIAQKFGLIKKILKKEVKKL